MHGSEVSLVDTPLYVQKGFGLKEQISDVLRTDYHSRLVDKVRENGFVLACGNVTFKLAKEFGFCYGVDRAIDLAYETREHVPEKTIYITNEIIHNPFVNRRLVEQGVRFLDGSHGGEGYTLESVTAEDVVIIPAFGVRADDLEILKTKGCVLVDTTCGSVMNVWRRVLSYAKDHVTSVIHGKYDHEETRATCSRSLEYEGGHYLVVRDKPEAQLVCDFIAGREGALPREQFLARFSKAISPGFDPLTHLDRIGVANQTTMLSSESLEIAGMLRDAVRARHGEAELGKRFRNFDTICSATQDRQDAVLAMGKVGDLDLLIVIGGYNSSNTTHLAELGLEFCPSFHIAEASDIRSRDEIQHKPPTQKQPVVARGWLPEGKVTVGITSGASTPNRIVGEAIERILQLTGNPEPGC
ncbi:4-hydroxy-3-methylbut-2-enyl diphosphate reductase [bacterium]|nr:4-hydroxy-3-methylbut-2-enyl diphosphate reductase [bacterium]